MENVSYVVLSYQMALKRHLEILANNVANMNSTAFRSERPLFQEYLVTGDDGSTTSYIEDAGVLRDFSEGAIRQTSNPLDVAITGEGYFVVESPDGPRYTRDGNWRVDQEGQIVVGAGAGLPLLDDTGSPIVINPGDGAITILADGTIRSEKGTVGLLNVVMFEEETALQKLGAGLFDAAGQVPEPAENFSVLQGMLEGSNVNGVVEMTRMMEVANAYRTTAQMNNSSDQLRRRAIQTIGQVLSA